MKTKLLLLLMLIMGILGFSQTYDHSTYFISEIIPSPPNNSGLFNDYTDTPLVADFEYAVDDCIEYFEFRGTPNATIDNDVYFIVIDGDGDDSDVGSNIGKVRDAVNLSGLQFGSNGILSIVANMTFDTGSLDSDGSTDISGVTITNPYDTALASSNATVVTIALTGIPAWVDEGSGHFELDKFNSVSKSPDIGYDGSINDQSSTYMIVKSTAGNPKDEIVDSNEDGVLDGAALSWTIYDSVSLLDDDDISTGSGEVGEFAYGKVIFVEILDGSESPTVLHYDSSLSPSIVTLNQYPMWIARQGTSTGFACSADGIDTNDDWMAGRLNSRSYPDYKFSGTGTRNIPSAQLTNNNLSDFGGLTYGEVNVSFSALSTEDNIASKLRVYPNPVKGILNIDLNNIEVSSLKIYDFLGKEVLSQRGLTNNKINISHLSSGMYLLNIATEDGSFNRKILVE
ncbi:T9SS type A sorting domain-containing protein [Seonamhaeicola sp. ML3]|uniref:T9SS type A sorting domain-containing protein n=1 Tax=Seonamhaeicola sp. ML3 TaxID=2937786 RepID=UPI00200F389B|nr:T9SS type A sorting domain-containing protein [Seonamhaeicola sp. ML3]